jgi:hypothetical protein
MRVIYIYCRIAGLLHLVYSIIFVPVSCFACIWHGDGGTFRDREFVHLVVVLFCFCVMNVTLSTFLFVSLDSNVKALCFVNAAAIGMSSGVVIFFLLYCRDIGEISPKGGALVAPVVSSVILFIVVFARAVLLLGGKSE